MPPLADILVAVLLVSSGVLVLVAALAWGDDRAAIDAPGFYDQSKHGWFWYEDPPAEPEEYRPFHLGQRDHEK